VNRRTFLKTTGAVALGAAATGALSACGSSAATSTGSTQGPTGTGGSGGTARKVTLGFISLTDCAPLVIAKEKGYFDKYGLDVTLENGKSWPGVRDKLISGEFDGAHALFSMPWSVASGVSKIEGGADVAERLRVAMMLNQNGQGITLASDLAEAGYGDPSRAAEVIRSKGAKSFGMTFPGGTHDMWLRYWMKAGGLDSAADGIEIKAIPPPDMFNNLSQENVRGYCVGEPWNARAVAKAKGFTTIATQDLWLNHPEKALVVNETFAAEKRDVLSDVMKATLEACQWCDDSANVSEVARIIGVEKYVNATPAEIESRLGGTYDLGADLGTKDFGDARMRFHRDGQVNLPRSGHAIWFMAQYVRFGYLDALPPAKELADKLILTDLYAEVASSMGITVPDDAMAPFEVKLDGNTFDPTKPELEAARS
jgi:nitrate/nitrite transport system substrate-binding protein